VLGVSLKESDILYHPTEIILFYALLDELKGPLLSKIIAKRRTD
jgi:hypothetical protein